MADDENDAIVVCYATLLLCDDSDFSLLFVAKKLNSMWQNWF